MTCHVDHATSPPVAAGRLLTRSDSLCLGCHTQIPTLGDPPHAAHPPGASACLDCHAPHESRSRNLTRSAEDLQRCAQCHRDFLEASAQLPYRHRFLDFTNQCGQCHSAHTPSDPRTKLLLPNVGESCLTCHDLPIRKDDRTLENVADRIRNAPYVHGAMREGSCPTCHTPHGSAQPSLLREGYPAGNYETFEVDRYRLCWQCHDPALVTALRGTGATRFRNGDVNLHRVHTVQLKRGRACHLCHAAHATDVPHLIRSQVTFGAWSAPLVYQATPDGGSCQSPCHDVKSYRR